MAAKKDALKEYSRKRDFALTPEPPAAPKRRQSKSLRFVVQKHAARRLHYDFRLELDGVLLSWAVPKGPSLNPADKRFAVQTEDHPFDYKDFEGIIPKGEYGGGEVIVWDQGTYGAAEGAGDEAEILRNGLRTGKLSIRLDGEKLKGGWTLIKMRGKEKDWLLVKHADQYADADTDIAEKDRSVVSGDRIEDLQRAKPALKKRVDKATPKKSAKKVTRFPSHIAPMLSMLYNKPFSKAGWIYEPKLDGVRAMAYVRGSKVTLLSRRGLDLTGRFPEIVEALAKQPHDMVLDGEIVALDSLGRPSFQLLQRAGQVGQEKTPVVYYAFDIPFCNGQMNVDQPLLERKALLRDNLQQSKAAKMVEALDCDGEQAYEICVENGLEGVLAKQVDSLYEAGRRSSNWLKIKFTRSDEFVILGYTAGTGARSSSFGALLLGYYDEKDALAYAGSVGTGFNDATIKSLLKVMKPLQISKSLLPVSKTGRQPGTTWLKPELVAEIKYAEWTMDRKLRVPVFMRLREDIDPKATGPSKTAKSIKAKR